DPFADGLGGLASDLRRPGPALRDLPEPRCLFARLPDYGILRRLGLRAFLSRSTSRSRLGRWTATGIGNGGMNRRFRRLRRKPGRGPPQDLGRVHIQHALHLGRYLEQRMPPRGGGGGIESEVALLLRRHGLSSARDGGVG